jgi:hypothetical protein
MVVDDFLFAMIVVGVGLGFFQIVFVWITWRERKAGIAKAQLRMQMLYKRSVEQPLHLLRHLRSKVRAH